MAQGFGLFPALSLLNHSCFPTCCLMSTGALFSPFSPFQVVRKPEGRPEWLAGIRNHQHTEEICFVASHVRLPGVIQNSLPDF